MTTVVGHRRLTRGLPGETPLTEQLRRLGGLTLVLAAVCTVGVAARFGPRMALAALVATAASLVILHRPAAGGLFLVAVVPVTAALARGWPIPGLRLPECLIAGTAAVVLLSRDRRNSRRWQLFDWLALAYVVTTAGLGSLDLALRHATVTADSAGKLLGPLQFFLLYRTVVVALPTPRLRASAVRAALVASVPMSFLGIAQELNLGPTRSIIEQLTRSSALTGYSFHTLARATGLFAAWQAFAGYLFVVLIVAAALWIRDDQEIMSRAGLLGVVIPAAVALVATLTMVAVLAVAVGVVVLGRRRRLVLRLTAALLLVAVLGYGLFGSLIHRRFQAQFGTAPLVHHSASTRFVPQTVRYRITVWTSQYLPALGGRYVSGYGPDIPPEVTWKFTESEYVTLLLRGGLPLLAVFIALMLAAMDASRKRMQMGSPAEQAVAEAVWVIVVLLFPMHLINPYFTDAGLPQLLWILFGLVFASRDPVGEPSIEASQIDLEVAR